MTIDRWVQHWFKHFGSIKLEDKALVYLKIMK